ncbi:MAG: AraC family transcriptional regulator [Gemmatimonadota bacterium]
MESENRRAYWARIQRAVDYIETHLHEEMTLEDIAAASFFSPFHFHRLFTGLMGEPVIQFVQRLRLERAANLLCVHPRMPVIRVAARCGYSNPAAFSRAFRAAFGTTPTAWRRRSASSKDGTAPSKAGKEPGPADGHPSGRSETTSPTEPRRTTMPKLDMQVRVERLPDTTLAYLRHVGPYAGDQELFGRLFGTLFRWAGPRGLLGKPGTHPVTVYHDDPGITQPEKLRISVGLPVPAETEVSGELGKLTLEGGLYAQARFELSPHQYGDAWSAVYGGWLPDSGYEPDDRPSFERYLNDPGQHPEGKHVVEICVPVKPR